MLRAQLVEWQGVNHDLPILGNRCIPAGYYVGRWKAMSIIETLCFALLMMLPVICMLVVMCEEYLDKE